MSEPHEKATAERREAAEEVLEALKELQRAAGMPIDEEDV